MRAVMKSLIWNFDNVYLFKIHPNYSWIYSGRSKISIWWQQGI